MSDDKKKPASTNDSKGQTKLIEGDLKKNSFQPQVKPDTKLTIPVVNPKTIPKKK